MKFIEPMIRDAHSRGALVLKPADLAAYGFANQNAFIRQFLEIRSGGENWARPSSWNCGRKKAFIKHGYSLGGGIPFPLPTHRTWFIGDIFEAYYVAQALAAGVPWRHGLHDQATVKTVLGDGHPDGFIDWSQDGPPYDIITELKSMSGWAFRNFKKSVRVIQDLDDTFGYRSQISVYAKGAIDSGLLKRNGKIHYIAIAKEKVGEDLAVEERFFDPCMETVEKREKEFKQIEASKTPFELAPLDTVWHKDHGEVLSVACSYCPHKVECWKEQRFRLEQPIPSRKLFKVIEEEKR